MVNWERREESVEVGFLKTPAQVVAEIEKRAETLGREGWVFVGSTTDEDLGKVFLSFEREAKH